MKVEMCMKMKKDWASFDQNDPRSMRDLSNHTFVISSGRKKILEISLNELILITGIETNKWIGFPNIDNKYYISLGSTYKEKIVLFDIIVYRINSNGTAEKVDEIEKDIGLFEIFFLYSNYINSIFINSK